MDMNRLFGKTVLWVGNEARAWGVADFSNAARSARALGFDSICVKRADGTVRWYANTGQLAEEARAVRAEGCGYIPFGYCYGPKFGDEQIRGECAILNEMAEGARDGAGDAFVQADMEAEWNGQVSAARLFCDIMRPLPIFLSVSTWADPAIQDWDGVAAALAPCVNAWTPQRYTDWLAHQPLPSEETVIQPGVDMSQEFGSNNPLAIATGHACVFVWERATAESNPQLARAICHRSAPPLAPEPAQPVATAPVEAVTPPAAVEPVAAPVQAPATPSAPVAAPGSDFPRPHTVQSHESLWSIAQAEYGNPQEWPTIYAANRDTIGPNPDIVKVGAVLTIPAPAAVS